MPSVRGRVSLSGLYEIVGFFIILTMNFYTKETVGYFQGEGFFHQF